MATVPGIMLDISANVARMQADMRRLIGTMDSGFGQIKSLAKGAGAAIAAYFAAEKLLGLAKQALETGDRLNKLSQSTGITVETLSSLKYAAELADLDLDSLAKGVGILSRNMFEAQGGTGEAAEAIKALGLSIQDTQGNLLGSDAVLGQIADKFEGMRDGAGKTALAMKLFGKSGAALIPLLNQGSSSLAEMRAEAEKMGLVMSTETAQQMERVNDNFTRMKMSVQGLAIITMSQVLPTLENLTNILLEMEKSTSFFQRTGEAAAFTLKSIASAGVVLYTTLDQVIKMIAASGAAVNSLLTGDLGHAKNVIDLYFQDYDRIQTESAALLSRIWDKNAEDALRAANKIKKARGEAPALAGDDEKQIEKRLKAIFEEAEALQMGADALDLYKKGLHGATSEQKDYALGLIRTIEGFEQSRKAILDRVKAAEEDQKQFLDNESALLAMVEAMKMQAITASMSEEETAKFQLTLKGASQALLDNTEAYFKAIRAARQYQEEIDLIKGVIEETKSPMDRYQERMKEIQSLLDSGMIGPDKALQAEKIAWTRMIGGEKDSVAEREQILLDFADRVRSQNRFTADAAIFEIERQAAIFKKAGADEVAVAIWAAKEKQKASREWQDGAMRGLEDYAVEATNAAKNVEGVISNSFKNMEDALVDFVKTGKLNFKSLVDSIIADLIRMAIRQNITGPMASGFMQVLSGLFATPGAGAGGGSGAGAGVNYGYSFHEGGIVGGAARMSRSMPAAYLAAAPRYHGGLQPDEFPAVLKRGEGVFTPEQMRAMGGTSISISIPISMSEGDNRKNARMQRDLEAEAEPVIRRIIQRYM
jgi:lambda family phage tail tape measure protein